MSKEETYGKLKFTSEFLHFQNPYDNAMSVYTRTEEEEDRKFFEHLKEDGYVYLSDQEVCRRLGMDINKMEKV